jgi:hypothetical protein
MTTFVVAGGSRWTRSATLLPPGRQEVGDIAQANRSHQARQDVGEVLKGVDLGELAARQPCQP